MRERLLQAGGLEATAGRKRAGTDGLHSREVPQRIKWRRSKQEVELEVML